MLIRCNNDELERDKGNLVEGLLVCMWSSCLHQNFHSNIVSYYLEYIYVI